MNYVFAKSPSVTPRCFGIVLVAAWTFASLSLARPCAAQSSAEIEIARERFKEGVAHYDARQFDKARLAFQQAYALKPHSAVLLNLAQSELRAGLFAEAAANFSKYIRENPSAPAMTHAKEAFEQARLKVAEVNVGVSIADATVMLDGADIGTSPLPTLLYIMPGSHVLSARIGTDSAEQVVQAVAGQQIYVTLDLKQSTPAPRLALPPPETSSLAQKSINVAPVLDPTVDDGFISWLGDSPGAVAAVTLGVFGLTTSAVLGGFANSQYAAATGIRSDIRVAINRDQAQDNLIGRVSACGDIANGRGLTEDLNENARDDRIQQYASACELFSSYSDSGDRLKTLAFVGLGVGALASIGTVVWYFSENSEENSPALPSDSGIGSNGSVSAALTPVVDPNTQGIWLTLSF